jgi:hypothetical protein
MFHSACHYSSQQDCCDVNCRIITDNRTVCRDQTDCALMSFCKYPFIVCYVHILVSLKGMWRYRTENRNLILALGPIVQFLSLAFCAAMLPLNKAITKHIVFLDGGPLEWKETDGVIACKSC